MKKDNLPLSPHLQIYKPQITSVLSISHRITGFALNFSLVILVLGLLSIALGEIHFLFYIEILKTVPLRIIFFLTILGFSYHLLNGIRHIFWDFGFFLEIKSSTLLGYLIILLTFILGTSLSIFLGLFS